MVQKSVSPSYTINPALPSLLPPLLVFFSVLIVLMQIQKCVLILSVTYRKAEYFISLLCSSYHWILCFGIFPFLLQRECSHPGRNVSRAALVSRQSLTLSASWPGLAWAGTRLFCLISFVTLGTSPLLPHLHYLIKWGHCEIKWDVINRASPSTSLNRWWFSSLSSVLFYCFILFNMMGLTIQSSAAGEDPSCHCH